MILSNVNNTPLRPFEPTVLDCLGEISAAVMKSQVGRQFPDLMAFAFYTRKANLQRLASSLRSDEIRLGRGLCFHVAPANIPINFAFTWMFSLLAGNANVVRLPSKDFPQVDALLAIITEVLGKYPGLKERNAFVKYPRTDNETTAAYCRMADCRMIWGGDRTIASIKALPAMPRCVDICFADRYSIAMIDGDAVLAADETQIARLAEGFYNDTYLMDQNACSSPQVILWEHDSSRARERFWGAVEELAKRKYVLQDAVAVDKYTLFCEESVGNEHIQSVARKGNLLYRVQLNSLSPGMIQHRGKAGFFFEYALEDRDELFKIVTEKFQTITQFGMDTDLLRRQIVDNHLRGIDRIVPIGQAMDVGVLWDGFDLVRCLSRIVA